MSRHQKRSDRPKPAERPKSPGRPKTVASEFVRVALRLPPDMAERIKSEAEMAHRPANWELLTLLQEALAQRDRETLAEADAQYRQYASA